MLDAQLGCGVVAEATAITKDNAPHIVLKGAVVTDVDGIAVLSITSNYWDWCGELVDHGAGLVLLDQGIKVLMI